MDEVKKYRDTYIRITTRPIIYSWWFKDEIVDILLDKLGKEVKKERIYHKDGYALLYIGSGKNGYDRLIKYHILDSSNFHEKGIENGRLSSLRQTICGLMNYRMSSSRIEVDRLMDTYCKIEWEEVNLEDMLLKEKEAIQKNYLPLNWQHTKGILTPEHRRILTRLRNAARN